MTTRRADARGRGDWQGMNWIRQSTRLAIYLRDGCACAYCGAAVEDGAQLTLDHCKPHSRGGSNKPENLITCCQRCNSARGARALATWIRVAAEYADRDAAEIGRHVRACRSRELPREEARELIKRRGSCAKALPAR